MPVRHRAPPDPSTKDEERDSYGRSHQARQVAGLFFFSRTDRPPATNLTLSERSDTVNGKSDTKRGNMGRKYTAAALLLVLILMLTLACSGDDSPAAPDTDRAQQELLERIDQQSNEVRDLREEVEQLRRSDETEQPSAQATEMPPTQATETIQPSSPTLAPPPEVSNTENICDRSPGDQRQLVLPVATTIFAGHMW